MTRSHGKALATPLFKKKTKRLKHFSIGKGSILYIDTFNKDKKSHILNGEGVTRGRRQVN